MAAPSMPADTAEAAEPATESAPAVERVSPRSGGAARPRPRLAGLDGLRALAVAAVVVFHLDYALWPGGFLGVDVFFVLSGFLITNLLVTEVLATGRLDVRRFFLRRIRRLMPTSVLVVMVVALASLTLWRDQLATVRGGVLATLGYATNWWLIGDHQSYFVATGRPSMLQHLWSLAIEEQYYLVWTLVVLAVLGTVAARREPDGGRRRVRLLALIALGAALASTLLMTLIAVHQDLPYGASTSRVYFGSDTHSMGLFLGSAGGAWLAWTRRRASTDLGRSDHLPSRVAGVLVTDLVGLAALVLLVRETFTTTEFSPGLYRGGFLAFDALVLLVVVCCTRRGSLFGHLLDLRPLRWVGLRSYSIYLWHWPVVVVTRPGLDVQGPEWFVNVCRVLLILALASLSYRLVEQPLRAGARPWRRRPLPPEARPRPVQRRSTRWSVAAAVVAVLALCIGTATTAQDPASASRNQHFWAGVLGRGMQPSARPVTLLPGPGIWTFPAHGTDAGRPHAPTGSPAPSSPKPSAPASKPSSAGSSDSPRPASFRPRVSAYGDSVLLGAADVLRADTTTLAMDAVEGRQATDVLNDLSRDARAGRVQQNVVLHTGDNGVINPDQLRSTLSALSGVRRVLLFTLRVPRDWQDQNNQVLRDAAGRYPNVRLVDWYALSANHPDWLYSDGIHLRPAGEQAYADILLDALHR